jgi:hypothetical protein
MNWSTEDRIVKYGLAAIVAAVVAVAGYRLWFSCTHHCVRSHQYFVAEHYETSFYPDGQGNVFPMTERVKAHWQTVCDAWEKNP